LKRYATALQHHHILYANNLLWLVVYSKRRATTVESGAENRLFSMASAIVSMEPFDLPLSSLDISWQLLEKQLDRHALSKKL